MKGCYCLIISLNEDIEIKIGSVLGKINFKKGCYVYVGSAMNSLKGRIRRHLSDDKKKHWHIDYLLLNKCTNIKNVILNVSDRKIECELAGIISKNEITIPKFGCSDCKCESHLIYFNSNEQAESKVKDAYDKLDEDFMTLEEFEEFL